MEDTMSTVSQFVSTVGFPIVAFAAMYYMCNTTIDRMTTAINELKTMITALSAEIKKGGDA